jgi:hypothetical protein
MFRALNRSLPRRQSVPPNSLRQDPRIVLESMYSNSKRDTQWSTLHDESRMDLEEPAAIASTRAVGGRSIRSMPPAVHLFPLIASPSPAH